MTKEERAARKAQRDAEKYAQRRAYRHAMLAKPGKLSKAGEWNRKHPDGLEGWFDMKAIMK